MIRTFRAWHTLRPLQTRQTIPTRHFSQGTCLYRKKTPDNEEYVTEFDLDLEQEFDPEPESNEPEFERHLHSQASGEPLPNFILHTEEPPSQFPSVTISDNNTSITYTPLTTRDRIGLTDRCLSFAGYFLGNAHHSHHVFYSSTMAQFAKRAAKIENKKFVDLKIVKMVSGNGGNGCVSFFRDAFKPTGPPDGGDGGNGGDVYIKVVESGLNSLHGLRSAYVAKPGLTGSGDQLDGKLGEDVVIEVPRGTMIRWIPDPAELRRYLSWKEGQTLDDLFLQMKCDDYNNIQLFRGGYNPGEGWVFKDADEETYRSKDFFKELNKRVVQYDNETIDEEIRYDKFPMLGFDCNKVMEKPMLILKGGRGGMGNMHFLTNNIRNPRFCKVGRPGITAHFLFELKLIADLGLVGLPNAGKSSLLRAISRARPRVGDWKFTTLQPTVGTIFTTIDKDPFTVADIPGIIKGASENKGMGLDFLRHIERSAGLVFVIALDSENPVDDLNLLLEEVGEKRMKDKQVLIVATKADLSAHGENYHSLKKHLENYHPDWKIVPVCAPRGENIDKCIKLMSEIAQITKMNNEREGIRWRRAT